VRIHHVGGHGAVTDGASPLLHRLWLRYSGHWDNR
jgi:hypothetical protein